MESLNIKELCHGNFILWQGLICTFEAVSLSGNTVYIRMDGKIIEIDEYQIEGLKISEKWLKVLDSFFPYVGSSYQGRSGDKTITLSQWNEHISVDCMDNQVRNANFSLRSFKIYFVHQLQNLYFLTCNQELSFNMLRLKDFIFYDNYQTKQKIQIEQATNHLLGASQWEMPLLPEETTDGKIDFDKILKLNFPTGNHE